uniref:Secreted protein n=1 Tax=Pararge aegeria TaxID=116150 RepID=S4NH88_9NEOP
MCIMLFLSVLKAFHISEHNAVACKYLVFFFKNKSCGKVIIFSNGLYVFVKNKCHPSHIHHCLCGRFPRCHGPFSNHISIFI